MKRNVLNVTLFSLLLILLLCSQCFSTCSFAAKPIKLVVNGKDITSLMGPIVESGRTLVPIRFVSEELGGEVEWNDKDRTVTIQMGNKVVSLKIGSHLVSYEDGDKNYSIIDVPPKIIESRTFVPVRFVANALGVGVQWDESTRTVYVDSNREGNVEPFFDINISTLKSGQTIKGKTELKIELPEGNLPNAKEIKYLLLDPNTAEGFVVARGEDLTSGYTWIPYLEEKGEKVLVAAIYDKNGNFLAGDAISVVLDVVPKVSLTGIEEGETLDNNIIYMGVDTSFVASYVKYEITNLDTGKTNIIGEDIPIDPYGQYKWEPNVRENGNYSFKAIAYDGNNQGYESNEVIAKVEVNPKLTLAGVSEGQVISKPVNLLATRNFDVMETQYILRDPVSGKEEILAKKPYGGYTWFPEPDISGEKEVLVRVKDTKGVEYESKPIKIKLAGKPIVLLEGVGPNQVLREPTSLKVVSNIKLDSVSYIFINRDTGKIKNIAINKDPLKGYTYTPEKEDEGYWNIQAIGKYGNKEIKSEPVPIRVYLGKIYEAVPIIEKDKFLNLASTLARDSWEKTGMSAALQTAQSILETGWGQSVPVDKYSGKLSYNLFGIKGEGPKGSVIYNTWEVYNGKTYYVDAKFRAYNSVEESWADHKNFLLNSERYKPFKEVMHDSIQGAWALKRTGYATDPEYALKLIRIIKQYDLIKLDKVRI